MPLIRVIVGPIGVVINFYGRGCGALAPASLARYLLKELYMISSLKASVRRNF